MTQSTSVCRVHYFDRQVLRRQDFADEQAYQIALRRRHNITHHSWGIVVGLEIVMETGSITLRPGVAVDGYGRELFVPVRQTISFDEFVRLDSNRLDVWLTYDTTPDAAPPAGFVACNADTADAYYRTCESPRLTIERAPVSRVNARRPKGVPPTLLDADVQLTTPDDPRTRWDVYLGRIIYTPDESDPAQQVVIDASDRHYADVRADLIEHSNDVARIELGRRMKDPETREIDGVTYTYPANSDRAFAVFVRSSSGATELQPRFEIDSDSDSTNHLRGQTVVHGNMLIQGVAQFSRAINVDDTVPRTTPGIYRAKNPFSSSDELRIDLGDAVANARSFVIGLTTDDGTFVPALTIEYLTPPGATDPQPYVTVHGDLKMEGLLESPEVLERGLTTETLNALLASFQAGSVAAGGK